MKPFIIKNDVWIYPGMAGWHFVYVQDTISKKIKKDVPSKRGFGSIPVTLKLGKTEWTTSIFPTKEGPYLLPLKASVRKKEGIEAGDKVAIHCTIL